LIKLDTEGRIGAFELNSESITISSSINRTLLQKVCAGESGISLNLHLLMKVDDLINRSKAAQGKFEETTAESLEHFDFHDQLNRGFSAREVLSEFSLIKSVNLIKEFAEIKMASLSTEINDKSSQHQAKLKKIIVTDLGKLDKKVSELLNGYPVNNEVSEEEAQTPCPQKYATIKSYILLFANIKKCLGDLLEDITSPIEINLMALQQCLPTRDPFKSHHENAVENILCQLTQYASFVKRFPFSQKTTKAQASVSFKEKSLAAFNGLAPIEIANQILAQQSCHKSRGALLMDAFISFELESKLAPENDSCFHTEVKKILLYQMLKNNASQALKSCLSIKDTILSAQEHFLKGNRLPDEIYKLIRHLCFGLSELLDQHPSEVKELYLSKNEKTEYTYTRAMSESYCRRSTKAALSQCDKGQFAHHLSGVLNIFIEICQIHSQEPSNWTNLEKWVEDQCSKRITLLSLVTSSPIMKKLLDIPFYKYQQTNRERLQQLGKISESISAALT
jgi:hypothetical protein